MKRKADRYRHPETVLHAAGRLTAGTLLGVAILAAVWALFTHAQGVPAAPVAGHLTQQMVWNPSPK